MMRALFTAATGVGAQQLRVDVIANNLANANTVGFKRSRGEFQDLLYETMRPAGSKSSLNTQVPSGIQIGEGTRAAAVKRLFMQGALRQTENQLDLAIEGDGFFQVTQPNGEIAYTRAGAFSLDRDGRLTTPDGFPVEPQITIPSDATSIAIGADGIVSVVQSGTTTTSEIGNITLVRFPNASGLKGTGRNLFTPTDASGDPEEGTPGEMGFGTIAQGFLENSNVSVAEELVDMIIAQRAYEINARVIQTADHMLEFSNNLR